MNVGETILLDVKPLSLVTPAGAEAWVKNGISHHYDHCLRRPFFVLPSNQNVGLGSFL